MTAADDLRDLKAATREAHEMIQDLQQVIREARQVHDDLKAAAQTQVSEQLRPAVKEGLEAYSVAITTAIDEATKKVYDRFDTISDILLGKDKTSRRRGELGLDEMAQMAKDHHEL